MKVSELSGALLNGWVAKAEGHALSCDWNQGVDAILIGTGAGDLVDFDPQGDWNDGGPIIEREEICVRMLAQRRTFRPGERCWRADHYHGEYLSTGRTFLEAAMRCFVKSKFGDVVPDEVKP